MHHAPISTHERLTRYGDQRKDLSVFWKDIFSLTRARQPHIESNVQRDASSGSQSFRFDTTRYSQSIFRPTTYRRSPEQWPASGHWKGREYRYVRSSALSWHESSHGPKCNLQGLQPGDPSQAKLRRLTVQVCRCRVFIEAGFGHARSCCHERSVTNQGSIIWSSKIQVRHMQESSERG